MIYITEAESAALVTHELAYAAAHEALVAAASPGAATFPVVLGHGSDPSNRFTVKSGADAELAGLKVGSYFPSNDAAGLPRHSSMIFLFDQTRGQIGAIVEGSKLNAYRTAAADAVATHALAREDASTLAIFGTGHQAEYEVAAVARVRSLERVLVVGRSEERAEAFAQRLRNAGISGCEVSGAEAACRAAHIIVTATTAREPLFASEWVQPGTHVSTMGSDATGKQELPPALFRRARLFCDLPEQSRRIGEFQHADEGVELTALGDVLAGRAPGRRDQDEITIFDSSGVSIQDLYIARQIIAAAGAGT